MFSRIMDGVNYAGSVTVAPGAPPPPLRKAKEIELVRVLMFPPTRGNVLMTELPIMPIVRTLNDDAGAKESTLGAIFPSGAQQW
jgi:hypothetical protein